MPLQVEDMAFKDGEAYADTYARSFWDDAFSKASFAGISFDERVAGILRRWPRNYAERFNTYKKVVDTDTGELVSWLKIEYENTGIDPDLFAPTGIVYAIASGSMNTP